MKRWLMLACLVLQALWVADATARALPWQWSNVERIVVFADVHGAYAELSGVLRQAGVIDGEGHWSGGRTHLISLGDLLSRGPDSRKVLDLLMRLETEARAAGGDVHVVLGNHEVMHLTGELSYAPPLELAQYAEFEAPGLRDSAFARLRAAGWKSGDAEESARAAFAERFPTGYLGHRAAFAPDGRYGAWLLQRPVLIRINDTLFVHGGLPLTLAAVDTGTFVAALNTELNVAVVQIRALIAAGLIDPDTGPADRERVARQRLAAAANDEPAMARLPETVDSVARFDAHSLLSTEAGPLWYRGTSLCNPLSEGDVVTRLLRHFGAKRAVIGHTPTLTARVVSRMDERVVRLDTGMLTLVYKGRPAALEITPAGMQAYYSGEAAPRPVAPEPRRLGRRPGGLDDDALEQFLREATVVSIEAMPGTDAPKKVSLERNGLRLAAIFKSTDTGARGARMRDREGAINSSQRWQHEVAAYRIDRLIGLELVPVTVERLIEGRRGSLQFWIDNAISHREAAEAKLAMTGYCPLSEQHALMRAFDALIANANRHEGNLVYERDTWMLRLIDHSRAFRLVTELPAGPGDSPLSITDELARHLAALSPESLGEALSPWLEREQIRALLTRRAALLKAHEQQNSDASAATTLRH